MTDLYAQTWFSKDGTRSHKGKGCANNADEISRRRHGKKGKRRHDCVLATHNTALRFDAADSGHNPCKNLNGAKYIGGGRDGRGNQKDFTGRANNFGNAEAALKCRLNNYSDASLRSWYQTGHIDKTGATGTRGDGGGAKKFRTFYEQLLFGIKTDAGTQSLGYCSNTANLMKEVGGGTCYDKIKSAMNDADANTRAREWCKTNRSSPKCKCVNVQDGGTNFINHCKNKFKIGSSKNVRYVWFGFDNRQDYLNITQIEVFSGKDAKGVPINILRNTNEDGSVVPNPAISFTASSTTTNPDYPASALIDGNYASLYHSGHSPNEWVQVDLGKLTTIDSIKVWNRQPCDPHGCEKRWRGAFIKLLDSSGNLISKSERIVGDHKENGDRVKTFKAFAERDDGWAGCPEIVSAFKTFEDAGLTSASGLFGNSDCLVPGLCDGSGVIMPSSGKPNACANKLAICDQKVAADNIQAQNLLIEQGCEINFEADTKAADGQTAPTPTSTFE